MFHERLKYLREKENITREHLAKSLDITYSALSKYETGVRQPDYDTLQKIAGYFGVTTDYLFGRTDQTNEVKENKPFYGVKNNKQESDIAKRLEKFREEIENSDGLAFSGEPLSDEAKESLIESMEHIFRQTQRINKKYIPKKHRDDE